MDTLEPAILAALREMGVAESDLAALRLILEAPGRWLVFVHQDHIVKVAKVEPEQSVKAALFATDSP